MKEQKDNDKKEKNIPVENKVNNNDKIQNQDLEDMNKEKIIENEQVNYDINELIAERDKYKDQALRLAAELENYRKRVIRERQEIIEYANEKLLQQLLPLLDDITSAIEAGQQSNDYQGLLKGIQMIQQKAVKIFEEVGVKPMENPVGQQFNVELQEALMHVPSEEPEGQILQLIQPGYTYNDKILRYAKVITSAGKSQEANNDRTNKLEA